MLIATSWGGAFVDSEVFWRPAYKAFVAGCPPPDNATLDPAECAEMSRDLDLLFAIEQELIVIGGVAALIMLVALVLPEPLPKRLQPVFEAREPGATKPDGTRRISRQNVLIIVLSAVLLAVAAIARNPLILLVVLGFFASLLVSFRERLTLPRLYGSFVPSLCLATFLVGFSFAGTLGGILGFIVATNVTVVGYLLVLFFFLDKPA